jgi:hypothetical protein
MTSTVTVPLTITAEAAARLAELGMEGDLECMLEYIRQTVTGLRRLEVILEPPYDTGDEPYITIEAFPAISFQSAADEAENQWGAWKVRTFPPEVCRHFTLLIYYAGE